MDDHSLNDIIKLTKKKKALKEFDNFAKLTYLYSRWIFLRIYTFLPN